MLRNPATYIFGGFAAITAIVLATWQIVNHLQHYTSPVFQRYIVRIIFMVPVYAVCSFLALVMPHNAVYFETIRVIYEAFVIYTFLSLCLGYVGGPGTVEVKMNGAMLNPSWWHCTCCLPPQLIDGLFVRRCKQGALQFVLLMPILGILSVVLYATGHYSPGYWGPSDGYLYITIVYNITYSVALFALFMFYLGTHDLLAPFNPLKKFILVKAVVFFTFWQGILIAVLVGTGAIDKAEDGAILQNLLICLEMLPASIFMFYAFPYTEYKDSGTGPGTGGPTVGNAIHAISIHDVASDTVHQFAPTYRDYVLYSESDKDGGEGGEKSSAKKPKTFRAKTFVPIKKGQEPNGSLLDGVEMSTAAGWLEPDSSSTQPDVEQGGGQPSAADQQNSSADQPANDTPFRAQAARQNGAAATSANPDLAGINDDTVGSQPQPATTAPAPEQPPQRSSSGAPAWADVDL